MKKSKKEYEICKINNTKCISELEYIHYKYNSEIKKVISNLEWSNYSNVFFIISLIHNISKGVETSTYLLATSILFYNLYNCLRQKEMKDYIDLDEVCTEREKELKKALKNKNLIVK